MLDLGSQKDTKYQVSRLSGREAGGRAGAVAVWGEEGEEERRRERRPPTTHNTHSPTHKIQIKSNQIVSVPRAMTLSVNGGRRSYAIIIKSIYQTSLLSLIVNHDATN